MADAEILRISLSVGDATFPERGQGPEQRV